MKTLILVTVCAALLSTSAFATTLTTLFATAGTSVSGVISQDRHVGNSVSSTAGVDTYSYAGTIRVESLPGVQTGSYSTGGAFGNGNAAFTGLSTATIGTHQITRPY